MRFLIGLPFVLTPAQTFGFPEQVFALRAETTMAAPPVWAAAGLLLAAMAALAVTLRLTQRHSGKRLWRFREPALLRSGEAARRRLGLAHAPPH